ncbi:MAG TPA: gephyrin-like molybdotransferase Glp [Geopsychrobacteraceae bacterium]|nr:gephyrin-like molybdotransferase Glp [Geopsychrobacteraceae bacterium]
MISYEDAVTMILENVPVLPPVTRPVDQALGLVLAEPVLSRLDLPPSDNSAMDGYAFCFADLPEDQTLRQVGFIAAGDYCRDTLNPGETVKIMTGAPVPNGCDTVVPIEEVTTEGDRIVLQKPQKKGSHVRYRGEEISQGDVTLPAGTLINSGAIGQLAASGIEKIRVIPPVRVAILSTGDELVELGEIPQDGKIVNSNSHLLAARVKEAGCDPLVLGIARDNPQAMEKKLRQGLEADLLITSGGVSVGDRDYVQEVLQQLSFEKKFWQVAIKPGKPVLFGLIGSKPILGLPGNPASSGATFDLFVRPALKKMMGRETPRDILVKARLTAPVKGGHQRKNFLWGEVTVIAGALTFAPSLRQASGQNRSMQKGNGLLPMPIGGPDLTEGSEVEIILLRLP